MGNKLKHRWSLSNNFLAGLTSGKWWELLRDNRFSVDPAYWHRMAFISPLTVINSWWARGERRRFGAEFGGVEVSEPPLFILGHWRSGTTLLHELLAKDVENFTFPNTYQVVNTTHFLSTEEKNTRRFSGLVPERRPMDNMRMSFGAPQEDEMAPCLTTLLSPYLGICLPRRETHYDRYLTFEEVGEGELKKWKAGMMEFAQKLTYKNDRPLLLKSPAHTARIRLLLELFPKARFVHIHRNPYEVYASTRHYFDTAPWFTYLQKPELGGISERILRRYETLYGKYFDEVGLIPGDRFCEIAFADLERDPVGQVAKIYGELGIGGYRHFEPVLRNYVESLSGYKKNRFEPLEEPLRCEIAEAWGESFERWGYSK